MNDDQLKSENSTYLLSDLEGSVWRIGYDTGKGRVRRPEDEKLPQLVRKELLRRLEFYEATLRSVEPFGKQTINLVKGIKE